jgi:hypothetical protein
MNSEARSWRVGRSDGVDWCERAPSSFAVDDLMDENGKGASTGAK